MTIYKSGQKSNALSETDIVIRKGIPLPTSRAPTSQALYNKARALEVGDCMDVPYSRAGVTSNLARDTGYTLVQRRVGDILRIWRKA